MKTTWFKYHLDWGEGMKTLSNEEIGNLHKIIVAYVNGDTEGLLPNPVGNERFVWPLIKKDIDNDQAARSENNYSK